MSEQDIFELLAGCMVLVAVAYIAWFFIDYAAHGPQDPGDPDGHA